MSDQDLTLLFSELAKLEPIKTDAVIFLGARSASADIARAVRHFRGGLSKRFILAGGLRVRQPEAVLMTPAKDWIRNLSNPDFMTRKTEAEHMYDVLRAEGVPARAIGMEVKTLTKKGFRGSTNTAENFLFSLPLLQGVETLTVCASAPAMMRALGTGERVLRENMATPPSLTPLAVFPFGHTAESWPSNPVARKHVRDEWKKIDPKNPNNYGAKGFCDLIGMGDVRRYRAVIDVINRNRGDSGLGR